jgi:hypothetical protein
LLAAAAQVEPIMPQVAVAVALAEYYTTLHTQLRQAIVIQ